MEDMPPLVADLLAIGVPLALTALSAWRFVRRWRREPRSLWLGISFLAMLVSAYVLVGFITLVLPGDDVVLPVFFVASVLLALLVMQAPLILAIVCLVTGLGLIRREGPRPTNLLSLGLGVCILLYLFLWPRLLALPHGVTFATYLMGTFGMAVLFTSLLFTLYAITAALNLLRSRRRTYDHVVVLGCGLMPDGTPTPLLQGRIRAGIEAWRQSQGQGEPAARLVMSGGKGADEVRSEGSAMRAWALEQGVPEDAVIAEEASTNTRENLLNSWALMRERGEEPGRVLVVSDDYHVYRALLLAKHLGLACDGRGARTKLYFRLNALVREFVAFVVIWRRRYVMGLAACAVLSMLAMMARPLLAGIIG